MSMTVVYEYRYERPDGTVLWDVVIPGDDEHPPHAATCAPHPPADYGLIMGDWDLKYRRLGAEAWTMLAEMRGQEAAALA